MLACVLLGNALVLWPIHGTASDDSVVAGIVVEKVGVDSAAEQAGIQAGDLLLSWSPAMGPPARGSLESPFDLLDVEIEQSPRGPVTLVGRRGQVDSTWTLPPVPFGLTARPALQGRLLTLYQEGKDLTQSARVVEGAERWRGAAALAQASGSPVLAAWFLSSAGKVLARAGHYVEADAAYEEALRAADVAAQSSLAPQLLGEWGDSFGDRSDWARAEELFRRALARSEKRDPAGFATVRSLDRLGWASWHRGDLVAAEESARRAFSIVEKLAPGSILFAQSLNNLGVLAMERGDPARAEEYHRRALELGETVAPGTLGIARVLNNLGQAAQARGDLKGAEGFLRRALAIVEKSAPESNEHAWILNSLGEVAKARGDLAAAEDDCRRALAMQEKLAPASMPVVVTLMNLADVVLGRGDPPAAAAHYERALAIAGKVAPGSSEEAQALHGLGLIRRRTHRIEDASILLLRALDALESQGAKLGGTQEVRSGFAASYASYYHDTIETLLWLGRVADALQTLERSRARLFLALLAERDLGFATDLPRELARDRQRTDAEYDRVQGAIASLEPGEGPAAMEKLLSRLRELREAQQEISDRIRKASPRLASLQYAQPLDLAGVRSALDPGTLLLSYSVGKESTVLFAVQGPAAPGSGLSVHSLPFGEKVLREKVEAFRHSIQPTARVRRDALSAEAAALYDLLIRPAESEVSASERLLISPDGPLHSLPFGALVREEGHPPRSSRAYLIERTPLHIVASATVYAELKKSRHAARSPGRLVAFGDPRYPAYTKGGADRIENPDVRSVVSQGFRLAPLPSSREEVDAITSLFPGRAQKYLGAEATEERAKSLGKDARYVHFACHGSLDERFPLNSGLALAIPERPANGVDNGLLQAWEIFERVRIEADLVTLSACDTALGKEMGGEGLLGLTRAFQYAGARSVLASLWAVSDSSTPTLMKRFYGYLSAGRSPAEALRAAQVDLIRTPPGKGQGSRLSHPFRWAAFQLYGDWQ